MVGRCCPQQHNLIMDKNKLKKQIAEQLREQKGFLRFRLWESRCGGKITHYLSFGHAESEKADTLWELGNAAVDACKEIGGVITTIDYQGTDFPLTFVKMEQSEPFKKLDAKLSKYGDRKLGQYECFAVRQFGKRGQYSDTDCPMYLSQQCKRSERICGDILKWITANRKGKNTLKVETIERVDHEDEQYSRYYETECYGSRQVNLVLSVVTPSGKVKASSEFWM